MGSDRGAFLGSGLQYVRVFDLLRIGGGSGFTDGACENVLDFSNVLAEGLLSACRHVDFGGQLVGGRES